MLTTAYSTGLFGIDGYIVTVECSFSENLPYFEIVGLPDNAVRESKRRLVAASENSARALPEAEFIINLAPADRRKEGSSLDLAMIAAIWKACGILPPDTDLSDSVLIGELEICAPFAASSAARSVHETRDSKMCSSPRGTLPRRQRSAAFRYTRWIILIRSFATSRE